MIGQYLISKSTLEGIADAIREKEGTSGAIEVSEFAERIENLSGSGGITLKEFGKQYISGELSSIELLDSAHQDVDIVCEYCFFGKQDITEINLSEVTEIGDYGFCGCTSLETINIPNCTFLGTEAFGLYFISSYDYGNMQMFYREEKPTIHFPSIERVGSHALQDVQINLEDLQNAIVLSDSLGLESVGGSGVLWCPQLETIGQGWIDSLQVENAYLPNCSNYSWWADYDGMYYSVLSGCGTLRFLTIAPQIVRWQDFCNIPNLSEMTLPIAPPEVEEYSNWGDEITFGNVFYGTPIYYGRGVIRVPDEHYESYLEHWFWGQTPIVPISEAGLVAFSSTPYTIIAGQTKTYEIGYVYGWDLESIYIDYFDVFGYIQIEDVFLDLESQILKVTVTALAPSQEDNNAEAIIYYLEDTQGHIYEGQFNLKVIEAPTGFTILPETSSTYGFDYYGPGIYTLQSNNSNCDDTTAETKVQLLIPHEGTLHLDWYIESESCCDKGSISSIDSTTYPANQVYAGNSSTTPKTGTLSLPVEVGEHFIYLKYRKDGSVSHGIDAFRVTFRFE